MDNYKDNNETKYFPKLDSEFVNKEKIGRGIYEVTFKDGTKDILIIYHKNYKRRF